MVRDARVYPRSERGRAPNDEPNEDPRRECGLISAERSDGEGTPSELAKLPLPEVSVPVGETKELPIEGVWWSALSGMRP